MSGFLLRPMRPDDADAVHDVTIDAFTAAAERAHDDPPEPDETMREAMRRRIVHCVRTDPDGCWVAERDGRALGAAMAMVREDLWILSLLMVRGEAQGQGVGRALMDQALAYGEHRPKGIIAASLDPYAWRRYWGAGFRLSPAASIKGSVRREALPVLSGIREGRADDYEWCDALSRALRGAGHGPDLPFLADNPNGRFWVRDTQGDRGFVVTFRGSPTLVAAERTETAQALLWQALAEAPDEVAFHFVTETQQWAFEVAFAAGLLVRAGTAIFTRGDLGPLHPYLPNGPFL